MGNLITMSDNLLETRLAEAVLYFNQGLNEEAGLIYKELLDLIGDQFHPLRGEVESRLKQLQGDSMGTTSKDMVSHSRPEDPDKNFDKKFNSCIGLMGAGFHAEAIDELRTLLETGNRQGEIYSKIGESFLRLDMPFDALEHLQKALETSDLSKDGRLDVLYQLAFTHERTGAVPLAIDALEQIFRIDPNFRNVAQRLEDLSQTAQKYGRFYYLIRNKFLSYEKLEEGIKIIFGRKGEKIVDANLKAIKAGKEFTKQYK